MTDQPGCPCSICDEDYVNQSDSRDSVGQSADFRTRIAATLRLHQWRATVRTSDDDPVLNCSCGIAFGGALDCQRDVFDCHREHVADAVIRELNLTQEWSIGNEDDGRILWDNQQEATDYQQRHEDEPLQTRHVTEWETVE